MGKTHLIARLFQYTEKIKYALQAVYVNLVQWTLSLKAMFVLKNDYKMNKLSIVSPKCGKKIGTVDPLFKGNVCFKKRL